MKIVNLILRILLVCVLALFTGLVASGTYHSWHYPGAQTVGTDTGLVFIGGLFGVFLACAITYIVIARRQRERRKGRQAVCKTQ